MTRAKSCGENVEVIGRRRKINKEEVAVHYQVDESKGNQAG
jgi:hypothetical protein